ncbi:MAG: DUF2254 domain-containing protein [Kofleriaceae bacterium]|nr:DUF2254 domain-containing protein [Kofleriaceae bacterium]
MFRIRQLFDDLLSGMVFRPLLITVLIVALAFGLVELEARGMLDSGGIWFLRNDPESATDVLDVISGSMMPVISIVYSVLLVALSMASMQFSPRVVGRFVRDRVSQRTLGVFIGTFLYSLIVMRSIRDEPPWTPTWAVGGAVVLGLACLVFLIYFIHHIATGIQASNLVYQIACETHLVIERQLSRPTAREHAVPPSHGIAVEADADGYLQLVDHAGLLAFARQHGVIVFIATVPGSFVARGNVLARIAVRDAVERDALVRQCRRAFDLGPHRTMQQDVAFGFRQLVDIALKAISPAVNDPTTACTCLDHLGSLLADVAHHHPGPRVLADGDVPRVVIPQRTFTELAKLAFNQIRQYGRTDLSVSIRILSAIRVAARAVDDPRVRSHLRREAELVRDGLSPTFMADDRQRFDEHWAYCVPAV